MLLFSILWNRTTARLKFSKSLQVAASLKPNTVIRFQTRGAVGQSLGLWDGLSPSSWNFKNSKMKQDTPFMWLQSSWVNHEFVCPKLCVQGATPEIRGDVLTPSCNHKVNRACTECMRQPSITCCSVWVALNPRCQPQWVHSTWHILERESLVYPGDQLALTGGSWPESHEEGFWDTLVKWMGEVQMGKNKWIWITHILDSLKAGLQYREGTGFAWPFVPSIFHSSNWKWNCERWNRSKGHFSVPPPSLCASEKWFRLIQADILKTFLWFGSQAWMLATCAALAPWARMLPGDWLTAAPASPAKKTSGRPLQNRLNSWPLNMLFLTTSVSSLQQLN